MSFEGRNIQNVSSRFRRAQNREDIKDGNDNFVPPTAQSFSRSYEQRNKENNGVQAQADFKQHNNSFPSKQSQDQRNQGVGSNPFHDSTQTFGHRSNNSGARGAPAPPDVQSRASARNQRPQVQSRAGAGSAPPQEDMTNENYGYLMRLVFMTIIILESISSVTGRKSFQDQSEKSVDVYQGRVGEANTSHARTILTIQRSIGISFFSEMTIYDYEVCFLIMYNFIKILAAIWFAAGEQYAGYALIFGFQLIRLIFRYNPFELSNQPPQENFVDDYNNTKGYESDEWLLSMKQRNCFQGIQSYMFMLAAFCLIISHRNYKRCPQLKEMYKFCNNKFIETFG